jgi:hypothetical protein
VSTVLTDLEAALLQAFKDLPDTFGPREVHLARFRSVKDSAASAWLDAKQTDKNRPRRTTAIAALVIVDGAGRPSGRPARMHMHLTRRTPGESTRTLI